MPKVEAWGSYRQSRKIGGSRPWNKYGVKTFQSYRLDLNQDTDLIEFAKDLSSGEMPAEARAYVEDLLDDAPESRQHLMGFLFFHEIIDGEQIHEGVTLSFGRKHQKRYCDRLDFVFEAPVLNGQAGSFSKLRIYVDIFQGVKPPLWETECDGRR